MASKRYKAQHPVVVDGKDVAVGETFEADEDAVAFLLEVGAVKAAAGRPPKKDDDED